MRLRTPLFLTAATAGSFFVIKEVAFQDSEVSVQNVTSEKHTPIENLNSQHQTTADQQGFGLQSEGTWAPSLVNGGDGEVYDWGVGYTEAEKEQNRKDAARIYGTLDDYTFKLYLPCTVGTGWILDYQIPKEGEYPTKWYIATNMHVIWRLKFSNERNDYGQTLMYSNTDYLRKNNLGPDAKTYKGKVRDKCENVRKTGRSGYFDMNFGNEKTWKQGRKSEFGAISQNQINEPKLFFSANGFLEREKVGFSNHFADFAVVEIEFTSQEAAREATNGFADKYNTKNNSEPIKFGRSIENKYKTTKDLWEAKDNYYILAYPVLKKNGNEHWKQTKNFNDKTTIASHLSGNSWKYEEALKPYSDHRGFVSAKRTSPWGTSYSPAFEWNGEVYHEFGHNYQFSHHPMAGGSSGGIFVDADGYAVGIINVTSENEYGTGGNLSWAQPFRSEGKVTVEGKVTPGYDLILGGFPGQLKSYREQVEKYIVEKQKGSTWLRESGRLDPKASITPKNSN